MSLRTNIDHLAAPNGIVTVVVFSPAGPRELRGDESWGPVLDASRSLLERSEERTVRVVLSKHTIIMQQEGDETVGVVLPTGHAVAKSLRRMVRRMARRDRAPFRSAFTTSAPARDLAV